MTSVTRVGSQTPLRPIAQAASPEARRSSSPSMISPWSAWFRKGGRIWSPCTRPPWPGCRRTENEKLPRAPRCKPKLTLIARRSRQNCGGSGIEERGLCDRCQHRNFLESIPTRPPPSRRRHTAGTNRRCTEIFRARPLWLVYRGGQWFARAALPAKAARPAATKISVA